MSEFLANNWQWLATMAILLFTGILGTVAWLRPRLTQRRLSWYTVSSVAIVSREIAGFPAVKVSFKGTEAEQVTSTVIKLRNSGAAAIESSATSDLIIEVPGVALGANISDRSKEVGAVEADIIDTDVRLNFDFINPGEEIQVSILHDGNPEDAVQPRGPLKNVQIRNAREVRDRLDRWAAAILYVTGLLVFFYVAFGREPGGWGAGLLIVGFFWFLIIVERALLPAFLRWQRKEPKIEPCPPRAGSRFRGPPPLAWPR